MITLLPLSLCLLLLSLPAFSATRYVATTGNDSTGDGTSGNPFLTIAHAQGLSASGDTIIVKPGRFEERVTITSAGLTFQAENLAVSGTNVDDKGITTNTLSSSRTSMRGFAMNSAAVSNTVIRGFEITSIGAGNYRGISLNSSRSNVIEFCYLHELEPDVYAGDGIGSSVQTTNNIIRSNALYKIEGSGISLMGWSNSVYGNEIYRGRERRTDNTSIGLDADATRCFGGYNVWRWNYLHDYWFSEQGYSAGAGPHMDGIMLFTVGTDGGVISNNVYDGNIIYSMDDQAINTSDTYSATPLLSHIVFINNIVWNCGTGGWSAGVPGYSVNIYDSPTNLIANNLFIKYGADARGSNAVSYPINLGDGAKSGSPGSRIVNNIFFGYSAGVNSRPVLDGGSATGTTVDYNLWDAAVTRHATPLDDHSQFSTNPLFAGVGTNWTLQSSSPARDAATVLSSDFTTDIAGATRGETWDIGAYEYGSGGDVTAPTCAISSPASVSSGSSGSYSTSSSTITVSGTSDDATATVTWSNSRGGSGTATGSTSWSQSGITLASGGNVLTFIATDPSLNATTTTLNVTYTAPSSGGGSTNNVGTLYIR